MTEPIITEAPTRPDPTFIIEVHNYVDEYGRRMSEHKVVHGEGPEDLQRFVGHTSVQVNTPEGTQTMPLPVPVQADSLLQAYSKLDAAAQVALDAFEKHLRQERSTPQILVPGRDGGLG